MKNKTTRPAVAFIAFLLPACAVRHITRPLPSDVPSGALRVVPADQFPNFLDNMDEESLNAAVQHSLEYYRDIPPQTPVYFGADAYTAEHMRRSLKRFLWIMSNFTNTAERRAAFEKEFVVYQATGSSPDGKMVFSAYYEPSFPASLTRHDQYIYPLYAKPPDLDPVKPYFTREQIDSHNVLRGKNLELAWAKDLYDVYLLQVEGSGWLELDTGGKLRIRYDGSNNRPYRSAGLALIQRHLMTTRELSIKGMRSYLNAHPGQRQKILNTNPRYIFFRLDRTPDAHWVLGSLLVPLTAGRSVATDPVLFPRGAPGWIETNLIVLDINDNIAGAKPFYRFILSQDEGGAIKGPARLDLFVGGGEDSARFAGHFWQAGKLYFFVLKP